MRFPFSSLVQYLMEYIAQIYKHRHRGYTDLGNIFEDVMYQSDRIPPSSIFRCNRDLNFSGKACVIQYVWPSRGAGSLTFLCVNSIDTSGLFLECAKTPYPI